MSNQIEIKNKKIKTSRESNEAIEMSKQIQRGKTETETEIEIGASGYIKKIHAKAQPIKSLKKKLTGPKAIYHLSVCRPKRSSFCNNKS